MNEIVNKFLLEGGKFMHEMQLKQSGFTFQLWPFCSKQKKNTKINKKQEIQDIFIKTN